MDFGKVPESSLMDVNFILPGEPAWNASILNGKPITAPKVYLGCAKWGRKEWVGKIYPKGTKEANFLDEYVKHYNSIELNATHYKLYDVTAIQKWANKTQDDFLFCPKVYQGISHFGNLKDKQPLTDTFLHSITAFGKHLGPIFLQLSDKFGPKRKEDLFNYLELLPHDVTFFLEVRHSDWFEQTLFEDLLLTLKRLKIGIVITDTAGRRDCCHMHLSNTKTFIRYVGNSLHETDYTRIDNWVDRLQYWLNTGLSELYFFMHMHDEALSPELTVYLVDKLNEACNLNLKKPGFLPAGLSG
ncbi:MAG: DUF72 domain-containing protein [Ginsengibacter sp.]